jgi:hypothetical protein
MQLTTLASKDTMQKQIWNIETHNRRFRLKPIHCAWAPSYVLFSALRLLFSTEAPDVSQV